MPRVNLTGDLTVSERIIATEMPDIPALIAHEMKTLDIDVGHEWHSEDVLSIHIIEADRV